MRVEKGERLQRISDLTTGKQNLSNGELDLLASINRRSPTVIIHEEEGDEQPSYGEWFCGDKSSALLRYSEHNGSV